MKELIQLIYVSILSCYFTHAFAYSSSTCEVLINNNIYQKEKLPSSKNYEFIFGLPVKNKLSVPIGYSIDVDCGLKNTSKLRTTLSFDIQKVPVEINYLNCDSVLFIQKVNYTYKLHHDQLKFLAQFKSFKNISSDIKMSLSLNRRLGDGCMSTILFYPDSKHGSLDFSELLNHILNLMKEFWSKLTSNSVCIYLLGIIGIFLIIFSILIAIFCVKICCKNNKSQVSFNNTLKKSKKNSNYNAKDFTNLNTNSIDIDNILPIDSSIQIDKFDMNNQIESHEKLSTPQETQKPIVENEFQILRKQLMSNMRNSSEEYENVYNNMGLKKAHKYKY